MLNTNTHDVNSGRDTSRNGQSGSATSSAGSILGVVAGMWWSFWPIGLFLLIGFVGTLTTAPGITWAGHSWTEAVAMAREGSLFMAPAGAAMGVMAALLHAERSGVGTRTTRRNYVVTWMVVLGVVTTVAYAVAVGVSILPQLDPHVYLTPRNALALIVSILSMAVWPAVGILTGELIRSVIAYPVALITTAVAILALPNLGFFTPVAAITPTWGFYAPQPGYELTAGVQIARLVLCTLALAALGLATSYCHSSQHFQSSTGRLFRGALGATAAWALLCSVLVVTSPDVVKAESSPPTVCQERGPVVDCYFASRTTEREFVAEYIDKAVAFMAEPGDRVLVATESFLASPAGAKAREEHPDADVVELMDAKNPAKGYASQTIFTIVAHHIRGATCPPSDPRGEHTWNVAYFTIEAITEDLYAGNRAPTVPSKEKLLAFYKDHQAEFDNCSLVETPFTDR